MRVQMTLQRGRTAGGIALTMEGSGNDNVKATAVRATDCQQQLLWEAARVSGGRQQRQPTRTVDNDGEKLEWFVDDVV
jgi:hypothetical protein